MKKKGHDKMAHVKHIIYTYSKQDKALQGMPIEDYMAIPDQSPRFAERHGMWKWWLYKVPHK
jgi:hypothetical protein